MIAATRRRTLVAGLALIVAVNLIVLAGVAYNRSGEPESQLRLSERELQPPWGWNSRAENSGVALRLTWRVLGTQADDAVTFYWSAGGHPSWLDSDKLLALGFEKDDQADDNRVFSRQLAREVFIALELDGPAYRQALERAGRRAAKEQELEAANPGNKEFAQRVKSAKQNLEREQHDASRLFAVDAALDPASLRARYPDRTRYAIVRGRVQPRFDYRDKQRHWGGYIESLSVTEVSVPVTLRQGFELPARRDWRTPPPASSRFEADVAFGKRLEPWIKVLSGKSS